MGDDIEFNPFYGVFPYRNFLEREGIPIAAVHLASPGFGRIVRTEGRRYWQAI